MKKTSFIILVFLALVLMTNAGLANEKPRLGVLRFTNQTSAGWWRGGVGRDLQDMLINELAAINAFSLLERSELDAVLGEQDLGASGRIDSATRAKIGQLKGAQYLVTASVSSFEESTRGTGGGIRVGRMAVGGERKTAYIAIDLRIIDTTTGEIADVRTIEAEADSSSLRGRAGVGKLSGDLGTHEKTPTGQAIRACIMEIVDYLECSLVKGRDHRCMNEYDKKEDKRRERTRDSIRF
jgi:curli biogenesis system outer membrane secretion channel CsgG